MAGKKNILKPMWIILMKQVELGEPTSLLDQVYFGVNTARMQADLEISRKKAKTCSSHLSQQVLSNKCLAGHAKNAWNLLGTGFHQMKQST